MTATLMPGTFGWIELATPEVEAAGAFYRQLFGWELEEHALAGGERYLALRLEDALVGGLRPLAVPQGARGGARPPRRPRWTPHVVALDLEQAARRIPPLGGRVIEGPLEVAGLGQALLLEDPGAAPLALWRPRSSAAPPAGARGSLCWAELLSSNVDLAARFYAELLGWRPELPGDETEYVTFSLGDQQVAGLMPIDPLWAEVEPHWMVYLATPDCEAAAGQTRELGGSVLVPPTEISEVGRFAALADPQGGRFAVLELSA